MHREQTAGPTPPDHDPHARPEDGVEPSDDVVRWPDPSPLEDWWHSTMHSPRQT